MDVAAATESALRAHRHFRHHPVAGAGLLDAEIDDDQILAGELLKVGVIDPYAGLQHLAQRQHLTGALGEPA